MPFKLGKVEIMPFRTASFMPCSLGFVFNTTSGSIVYVDHYMIPTSVNNATLEFLAFYEEPNYEYSNVTYRLKMANSVYNSYAKTMKLELKILKLMMKILLIQRLMQS